MVGYKRRRKEGYETIRLRKLKVYLCMCRNIGSVCTFCNSFQVRIVFLFLFGKAEMVNLNVEKIKQYILSKSCWAKLTHANIIDQIQDWLLEKKSSCIVLYNQNFGSALYKYMNVRFQCLGELCLILPTIILNDVQKKCNIFIFSYSYMLITFHNETIKSNFCGKLYVISNILNIYFGNTIR